MDLMERWGVFLLTVFAVYRVAMLLSNEEGPFSLAEKFRQGVRRRTQGKPAEWMARGVECPRCVSFWLSGFAAIILVHRGYAPHEDVFLVWLGVAGVVFLMLVLIPFEIKIVQPETRPQEHLAAVDSRHSEERIPRELEVVVRPAAHERTRPGEIYPSNGHPNGGQGSGVRGQGSGGRSRESGRKP